MVCVGLSCMMQVFLMNIRASVVHAIASGTQASEKLCCVALWTHCLPRCALALCLEVLKRGESIESIMEKSEVSTAA